MELIELDENKSIIESFEEQAEQYGDRLAVKAGKHCLSYDSLNKSANRIAHVILGHCGENSPQIAALMFGHAADMITGVLGALKANRIYVPLDPSYPMERLEYILLNSEAGVIITNDSYMSLAKELRKKSGAAVEIINISEKLEGISCTNPHLKINAEQSAYIMYTSGSTGRPKGVLQSHRNILHFARCYANWLQITAEDRIVLFSSYSHAIGAIIIFSTLLKGAALYPYGIKAEGSMEQLIQWLGEERITVYMSVPTLFRYCMQSLKEGERLPHINRVVLGGEAVYKKDAKLYQRHFSDQCHMIHLFGASEILIGACYRIDKKMELKGNILPLDILPEGVQICLLDESGKEVGPQETGEITYRSRYLSEGYWRMEDKTKEVFTDGAERFYKSGDLGRRLNDGSLEFTGRKDFQAKIRGYRIELNEIEAILSAIDGIKESVVAVLQNEAGENYLAAYYSTGENLKPEAKEIRELLRQKLPDFMVPSFFIPMEKLPLTPNRKVDRKALPKPQSEVRTETGIDTPANEAEAKLIEIWKEVLRIDTMGVTDSFFNLGGHSLKATVLASRIHKEFQTEVSLEEILEHQTVRELANHIIGAQRNTSLYFQSYKEQEQAIGGFTAGKFTTAEYAAAKSDYYPLSAAQQRMYILNQMEGIGTAYNTPWAVLLQGRLDRERLEASIKGLIKRHEALRTAFIKVDRHPVQKIYEEVECEVRWIQTDENLVSNVLKDFVYPFELSKAPLFRIGVIELNESRHILVCDMHHIIFDGTSMGIFLKELMGLYDGNELPDIRLQYKDYAVWQEGFFRSGELKKQEEYWLDVFSGKVSALNMHTDYPRPMIMDFQGSTLELELEGELTYGVKQLMQRSKATLFMVLLAAYNVLLSKITGQEDIVIGATAAGRNHPGLDNIIGMFINTLALRNYPTQDKTFMSLLEEVRKNSIAVFDNQDYQFDMLLNKLNLERYSNRTPLFDVVFNVQNMDDELYDSLNTRPDGLKLSPYELKTDISKFDLLFYVFESSRRIRIRCTYRTSLFQHRSIHNLLGEYKNLLEQVVQNPYKQIKDYRIDKSALAEREENLLGGV